MTSPTLPPDDTQRALLHNEVHARPQAHIRLPALVVYVAVLNQGVSREQELAQLRLLPGQQDLAPEALQGNFLRLHMDAGFTVKWERHSEFTRYSIVQPLPAEAGLDAVNPQLSSALQVEPSWLAGIPGRTVAAVKLAMLEHAFSEAPAGLLARAQRWLGGGDVLASQMGAGRDGIGHSMVVTDLQLRPCGFERMLVLFAPGTTETRAGRISQRLLELETYRLMALRGLPAAKALAPVLGEAEAALARVTEQLVAKQSSEQDLLDALIAIAAQVERATAQNAYRFSATQAYYGLVQQRIAELRERPIPGTQTLGEFMQRRLSPAIATVAATAQRLASLSARTERASALLRTRVDIARETQNQQLLAKLTRGQELQLKLQTTVEGLSIAAISYYVISLLLYGGKALKSLGLPLNPELLAGALIPLVLWAVWRATQKLHAKLHH
ncbi:DUF3422 family protein [Paucibacter soli]|uniref:DUF3422 family protein n=1 Tax=Paucibacter soli TaxID=3133433 RepID=UPI00309B9CE1